MTRITLPFGAIAIALVCSFGASPALAQRVFVTAQGSDANPCSFALPCRTFQHAHDVVASGGEIDVLDPAGYGAVNITKAISIQGHGFAGISVGFSGTGIRVNVGASNAVSLNGLLIDGAGAGNFGIEFNAGGSLVVENCVVRNFSLSALAFRSSAATLQTLSVSNSYVANSGASGIILQTLSSGGIRATIERTAFFSNGPEGGLNVLGSGGTGPVDVAVTDSVASNGSGHGFRLESTPAHSVGNLLLLRTTAAGNATGISVVGTTSTVWLAQSAIAGNTVGYSAADGGTISSYGDNYIDANGSNLATLGSATKH